MIIVDIRIEGLFGYLAHHIKLNEQERITIIHGPNGVGKTSILRMLDDIFSRRFWEIRKIRFHKIEIRFKGAGKLVISKSNGTSKGSISFLYESKNEKLKHSISTISPQKNIPPIYIERYLPFLNRVGPDQWFDSKSETVIQIGEVFSRYGDRLPEAVTGTKPMQAEFRKVFDDTNLYFIGAQRLFTHLPVPRGAAPRRYPDSGQGITVEQYSKDMITKMKTDLTEFGSQAASLDRDFPSRLLKTTRLPKDATVDNIRALHSEQMAYRQRLMNCGIINLEPPVVLPAGRLEPNDRKMLWIYLNDVKKKFGVFDALLPRAELLLKIINSHFLYKTFTIHIDKGFVFKSKHDETEIPLGALSSGEQHELVLAYDLLFNVNKNSLVCIDEPELSLHVGWQLKFLTDLAEISKLADLDFLLATHSSSIIHGRRDLLVPLGSERG